jgi:hypothetical protein
MSTSGVYNFAVARDDIIRQALLNIGKVDADSALNSRDVADCSLTLNMMCKQWMGKSDFAPGLKVFTRKRGHCFLSVITGQYSLGPTATGWTNTYAWTNATTGTSIGTSTLNLTSAVGFVAGYNIGIQQTDGSLFWTTIVTQVGLVTTLTASLPVGAAAGAYVYAYQTAAQAPLNIEAAVLRDQNLVDYPLNVLRSVQDYDILANKAQMSFQQDPTVVWLETGFGGASSATLFTDAGSASDVTKHIVLTYMEPVQDFVNPTDNPYYPQEWYLALCWGLSKNICPQYNRIWTELMQSNLTDAMAVARHKDSENTSLYFQPGVE